MLKILIFTSLFLSSTLATLGIDLSIYEGSPDQNAFDCFKRTLHDIMIIQIWRGKTGINPHFTSNWQKSKAAGIQSVDAYAHFCNNCEGNTPVNICNSIKKNLPSGFDGMLWFDIEEFSDCKDCWKGTPIQRLNFIEAVAATCFALGFKLGIYSGHGSWENVFGSASFDAGPLKALPLWYAHYDKTPNFKDWETVKFGGWSAPIMKQYEGDKLFCGVNSDLNIKIEQKESFIRV